MELVVFSKNRKERARKMRQKANVSMLSFEFNKERSNVRRKREYIQRSLNYVRSSRDRGLNILLDDRFSRVCARVTIEFDWRATSTD